MQTAKQFSVSLANKPGRLADLLAALHKGKVDFRALVLMDSNERRTVRFVPEDAGAAAAIFDKINVAYETTDVLMVEVPSQAGGFRKICERLATEHLNVDYAYCSSNGSGRPKGKGGSVAIIKVNDLAKAQRVLTESGTVRKRMPIRRPIAAMMGD